MRARAGVGSILAALCLAPAAVAQPFSGEPSPTTAVHAFRAVHTLDGDPLHVSWRAPEWHARREPWAGRPYMVERPGRWLSAGSLVDGNVLVRGTFPARPDRYLDSNLLHPFGEFVLAEARGGRRELEAVDLEGEAAWKATMFARSNECSPRNSANVTIWLSRETLLPLQIDDRGWLPWEGRERWRYSDVNAELPASDFASPFGGRARTARNQGFRRAAPGLAASRLSYRPRLPSELPAGFSLAVSGWAPRSGATGLQGRMAPRPELFAAVYTRGPERIEVTQRLAAGRGWGGDPFRFECGIQRTEGASVHGRPARYGLGPEVPPHLYWRRGRLLFTVSGPFPKRDLLAIARSLRQIP